MWSFQVHQIKTQTTINTVMSSPPYAVLETVQTGLRAHVKHWKCNSDRSLSGEIAESHRLLVDF